MIKNATRPQDGTAMSVSCIHNAKLLARKKKHISVVSNK